MAWTEGSLGPRICYLMIIVCAKMERLSEDHGGGLVSEDDGRGRDGSIDIFEQRKGNMLLTSINDGLFMGSQKKIK